MISPITGWISQITVDTDQILAANILLSKKQKRQVSKLAAFNL
jgi:hypothetical protein